LKILHLECSFFKIVFVTGSDPADEEATFSCLLFLHENNAEIGLRCSKILSECGNIVVNLS